MKANANFRNQGWTKLNKSLATPANLLLLWLCLASAQGAAQTYSVLHIFTDGSGGTYPSGGLVLSGPTLYGVTHYGGISNKGTIFKLNTNGSAFAILKSFAGTEGAFPGPTLTLSDSTLFGTTGGGGSFGYGTVFSIRTDGSVHTVLKQFEGGSDGGYPSARVTLSGSTLYGTASTGGTSNHGTLFKISTDGSGFTVLKRFAGGSDGANPYGGLTLSGTTLYGTTANGGTSIGGTIFKIQTDGSGYAVLKSFAGPEGSTPVSDLVLDGSTLYGTTRSGTPTANGSIFKLNTNGSGFTLLKSQFVSKEGVQPGQLLMGSSGTKLYGTTPQGGPGMANGTIFTINTDGSGYAIIHGFDDRAVGYGPSGVLLSGTTFYGNAFASDPGEGCVFSLDLPIPVITPQTQTAEIGSSAQFVAFAAVWDNAYEWFFQAASSLGATNSFLQLTNLQSFQSGSYTVVVSNLFGSVTSAPATLNVIPFVQRRPVPAINLISDTGSSLNVEYTDALDSPGNWLPLDTVNMTNTSQLCFDATEPLPPQRFYRVGQAGTPDLPPSLSPPYFVPAITLSGNVGASVRVDGIIPIGPTDAWFTLDTVTLTNATQLYFDISAPTQPPRLYRLVPLP